MAADSVLITPMTKEKKQTPIMRLFPDSEQGNSTHEDLPNFNRFYTANRRFD